MTSSSPPRVGPVRSRSDGDLWTVGGVSHRREESPYESSSRRTRAELYTTPSVRKDAGLQGMHRHLQLTLPCRNRTIAIGRRSLAVGGVSPRREESPYESSSRRTRAAYCIPKCAQRTHGGKRCTQGHALSTPAYPPVSEPDDRDRTEILGRGRGFASAGASLASVAPSGTPPKLTDFLKESVLASLGVSLFLLGGGTVRISR
jgi:hypothetical protein